MRRLLPGSMGGALATGVALAASAALFAWVIGFSALRPDAAVWVNPPSDMNNTLVGLEALLHGPWRFPPSLSDRINSPRTVSILFTDGVPWLAIFMKALGLQKLTSPLGLLYFVSYLLQALGMVALLAACGARRRMTLLAGALLALMLPTWLMRQFGHASLSAHWLLLFALALAIDAARRRFAAWHVAGFCLLTALSFGVHPYHAPPIALLFGAAVVSDGLQRRPRWLARSATGALAMLAAALLSLFLVGFWATPFQSDGGGALGFYSMNLAGPFWPQDSAIAGQSWNGVWFEGVVDPTGGQAFEGYNYLGAGILLILAGGLAAALRGPRGEGDFWRRYGPLGAALLLLTLWAIGPTVYLGSHTLLDLPKPRGRLGDAIGSYRAHGRFFWTVAYALLVGGLAALDRAVPKRWLCLILIAAVGLQAWDVSGLARGVRSRYHDLPTLYYPSILLGRGELSGRPWRFSPTYFCTTDIEDRVLAGQLALLAVRLDGRVNSTATSRRLDEACSSDPAALTTATEGDPTLTVALDHGRLDDPELAPFRTRSDCYRTRRALLCGNRLESLGLDPIVFEDWRQAAERPAAAQYALTEDGGPSPLGRGWAKPESQGTWSDGPSAEIDIPAPLGRGDIFVRMEMISFSRPPASGQRVVVLADDVAVKRFWVDVGPWTDYLVKLPRPADGRSRVHLTLQFPDAQRPPGDPRRLGVGIRRLVVS